MSKQFKIAIIPGDGIGKEVMPEGLRVLEAVTLRFDIDLAYTHIAWASCDHYAQTGQMMPDDWKEQLQDQDAIFFGAVGWPATVPDHVSLWGSLLKFRREFDQYINLRPVRLFVSISAGTLKKLSLELGGNAPFIVHQIPLPRELGVGEIKGVVGSRCVSLCYFRTDQGTRSWGPVAIASDIERSASSTDASVPLV